jgi:hypothetical protein
MIPSIVAGLVVAFVSGLTFVAYKHPAGYRKLHIPLIASAWGVFIIHMIYYFGETQGFYQALDGVRELNKDKAVFFQTPSHASDPIWWFIIPMSFVAYVTFLRALPSLLDLPGKER